MANRFPLTLNTTNSTIEELPSGTNLDLSGSNISNVGNITAGNSITANYFTGTFYGTANAATIANSANSVAGANVSGEVSYAAVANSVAGANVTGTVSSATTATTAGTVTTAAQGNITSLGTLTGLTVNGTTNLGAIGNVKITGGTSNQLIQTDGAGNLSFASVSGDSYQLKPVRVATTDVITLSGTQTVDGVALSVGDRVLVWLQNANPATGATTNGVYVVQSGSWTRTTDFDTGSNTLAGGVTVTATAGNTFAGVNFVCTNTTAITVGSTSITFQRSMNTGLISIWTGGGAYNTRAVGSVNSGALAFGVGANASTDSTAIGYNALARSTGVSVGYGATAASGVSQHISLGVNSSVVGGIGGIAVGTSAVANAYTVSVGGSALGYGDYAVVIGHGARGNGSSSVRVGQGAGGSSAVNNTNAGVIAVGAGAGYQAQGANAIAVGNSAAEQTQGANSVAIGYRAGFVSQGSNSIAIGYSAGYTSQASNSIILNATGANLNQTTANTFTVKPIRNALSGNVLYYDSSTGEITYTNTPLAITATDVTVNGLSVGTKIIPQNSESADYTLVADDSGKQIFHPSADTTARTFTIPANSSVPYDIGTTITFINQSGAGNVSIAITTDTMRLAGNGATGTRTLTANGVATAIKLTSTEWIISGVNLT